MIYQALSEARQEGKVKRKLYTKIILERAREYLSPYLKSFKKENGEIDISEEENKKIKLELLKDKSDFEERKLKSKKVEISETNQEASLN